jgi:valyl-tRNA synthetase
VLDPERKKMSKSKGNVVTPMPLLERYGADAVRYWAASARLGADTAFDESQIKVGRRLAIKVLNASRFVLPIEATDGAVTEALDRSMLRQLTEAVEDATRAFHGYDHARALEITEFFFWSFCDDYLELVKGRAYGGRGADAAASAVSALRAALSVLLRMFGPFLPYVTEEVWSWWREGSVHLAPWPSGAELARETEGADPAVLDGAAAVLGEVRKFKALNKQSLRARAERVVVRDTPERLAILEAVAADVRDAGNIESLEAVEADAFAVETTLAPS